MNLHGLLGPSFFRSATTLMVNPKYEIFRNVEKMGVLVHNLSKSAQKWQNARETNDKDFSKTSAQFLCGVPLSVFFAVFG